MGDPVGIAAYAREHLNPDGTVLLVEPFALDDKPANMTHQPDVRPVLHGVVGDLHPQLAVPRGRPRTGAQAGEARLREVFEQAGFSRFRRAAETPMNLILEARPLTRPTRWAPTAKAGNSSRPTGYVDGTSPTSPRCSSTAP